MSKQSINLGTAPTGVGGDTPRSAFTKANANFDELYARDAALGTAANRNVGVGANDVMAVGAFGLGLDSLPVLPTMDTYKTGFGTIAPSTQHHGLAGVDYGTMLTLGYSPPDYMASQLFFGQSPANLIGFRSGSFANAPFLIIYHTGNTTRAADGTLKAI